MYNEGDKDTDFCFAACLILLFDPILGLNEHYRAQIRGKAINKSKEIRTISEWSQYAVLSERWRRSKIAWRLRPE